MAAAEHALLMRLAEYDGRATTILGEAEAACAVLPDYIDALIKLAGNTGEHVSEGATWLLKSALEKDTCLSGSQTNALAAQLPKVTAWAAQLHLCQCVQHLALTQKQAELCAEWLEPLLEQPRPFLRAWAVDALCHCADADATYRTAYETALAKASADEAASVRARARQLAERVRV